MAESSSARASRRNPEIMFPRRIVATNLTADIEGLKALILWHLHCNHSHQLVGCINLKLAVYVRGRNENSGYENVGSVEGQKMINDSGVATLHWAMRCCRRLGQDRFSASVLKNLLYALFQHFYNLNSIISRIQVCCLIDLEIPINQNTGDSNVKENGMIFGAVGARKIPVAFAPGEDKSGKFCYKICDRQAPDVPRRDEAAKNGHRPSC